VAEDAVADKVAESEPVAADVVASD